ncbi:MAG: bifunctional (p)ppGpp synthetase/guanosine-3',5'-bis(diphosphate) 3'-pyrophosphohydrolase [Bacilli bacterium]|nr:bifunctional (p)ppGpp synthetase/guanosine-3',5'-bis(diphosphate) 3'-pyrophosphohydrolase [Bacilli bacterium]
MAEKVYKINGGYPLHTFEDVEDIYFSYIRNKKDRDLIKSAYKFILKKHDGQTRRSGEPYYHHLIEVAYILAELRSGPSTICAGLLHDVVEDTDVTIEEIQKGWGKEVAKIVDALTKIQRLKLSKITAEEFEAEDHRKIFLGMAKDIRVIIIKLADRLHNMRTLAVLSDERKLAISKETLEVFVPIAHRLGLDKLKSELEDLSLKYAEPEKYQEIASLLKKKQKVLLKSLESLKKKIADILFESNIPFEISARVKSIYSIYRKMYVRGHQFDEIYDILALRIITKTEIQCYEILGLIHKTYTPAPGRFKDYIAMPKSNMYQSLHTTIVGGDGNFYEVQIRTREMDEIAESGVAAHWAYKEGTGYNPAVEQKEIENKLHWFRDFVSMSEENQTATEYMDSLSKDVFDRSIYVFTPKGRVVELPVGSCPIDFAYRIHTKIGDSTVGALVNKTMVPLYTVLKTGDMVEIKTSKTQEGPSEGWLKFVQSNTAKNQIKKYLAKKNEALLREEKVSKGKQALIDAFRDRGIDEKGMLEHVNNPELFKEYGVETVDDLFYQVFQRNPTASAVVDFLGIKKEIVIPTISDKKPSRYDNSPVYCNGADNIAITLANCCTPIPGDPIIGYVTKGKGISVHRADCPNMANEGERLIDVFWKEGLESQTYPVDIVIESSDRNNLLVDVMHTLTNNHINIKSISAKSNAQTLTATISSTIMIQNSKKLQDIFAVLHGIPGVFEVSRVIH